MNNETLVVVARFSLDDNNEEEAQKQKPIITNLEEVSLENAQAAVPQQQEQKEESIVFQQLIHPLVVDSPSPPPLAQTILVTKPTNNEEVVPVKMGLVSIRKMFRFATCFDYFLIALGTVSAIVTGVGMSGFVIIFGLIIDRLNSVDPSKAPEAALYYLIVGAGVWVSATLQVSCFTTAAERMTIRCREQYLKAVLAQEISFFDQEGTGSLASKVAENTLLFREALGEKFGSIFQFSTMFLSGIIVGFTYVWQLCLVIIAMSPLLGFSGYILSSHISAAAIGQLAAYAKAGTVAEESLRLIRTVTSFGMHSSRFEKYESHLIEAAHKSTSQGVSGGMGHGSMTFFYFISYSVAFWVGALLISNGKIAAEEEFPLVFPPVETFCVVGGIAPLLCAGNTPNVVFETAADVCGCALCRCGCFQSNINESVKVDTSCITGGDVVLTFFSVLIGSFAIGQAAPSISALTSGRAAATMLFDVIDRKPKIDARATTGLFLKECKGEVKFSNVSFQYPTRNQMVLKNISMTFPAGKRVALIGESGSGKSTIIALLERYYDPTEGHMFLDGHSFKDLNLQCLRRLIGLVSQEPVLFATTVMENVRFGKMDASDEQVIEACKQANAHSFILEFAEKDPYQTFVNSSLVSGGQKQRIAIARALLRNPAILLLDEATAALDNESERLVNEAIDKLLQTSRTTVVIAHRLSSIASCDRIFVLDQGRLVEEGKPLELAAKSDGFYAALLKLSNKKTSGEEEKNAPLVSKKVKALSIDNVTLEKDIDKEEENSLDNATTTTTQKSSCCGRRANNKKKKTSNNYSIWGAFKYSYPDRWYFIPGVFAALINGVTNPVFALLFANFVTTFFLVNSSEILNDSVGWCLAFFGLGLGSAIAVFFENFVFGFINGRTTMRVRMETFRHMLGMEIGYFDLKENNIGALTTRLGADCGTIKCAVSDRIQVGAVNLSTIISGFIIAFYGSWQVALVTFSLFPMLIFAGIISFVVMSGVAGTDQKSLSGAAHTLTEAITGIRTVTAFDMQDSIAKLYMDQLQGPLQVSVKKGFIGGFLFGFAQAVTYFGYTLAFWYGSTLVVEGTISFTQMNQAVVGILMTALALGQAMALFPDIGKGQAAVNSIFGALSRKSLIDPYSTSGLTPSTVLGDLSFSKVKFSYPSRPNITVLQNFSLEIARGQTVAFVGSSGSGKSTLVLLLERFYDASSGSVKLDGVDVSNLNVSWLRNQMGIVSQEPCLFQGTILENIQNGKLDATREEVIEAAKMANCHDFIERFPESYDTMVQQGSLSGGQKQRVCIARALLRKPKILLLDEATSALDEESQRVVQDALDRLLAISGRTTIVVAHRLSTIRNADVIVVLQNGVVVEQGSYDGLTKNQTGAFSMLLRAQQQQQQMPLQ